MKIYTVARDAKRMEMSELEAINRRVAEVQSIQTDNGTVEQPEQTAEETKETAANSKTTRSKKKKAGVRPDENRVLPEA